MLRPSGSTSSQRSSAWRRRACVTSVPWCQNVPERSRRRPIARIFSISSGVSSIRGLCRDLLQASDSILRQELLLFQARDLGLFGGCQGAASFELFQLFVESSVFCGQLGE